MGKITVHRKGYHRRGYRRKDGTYVKPCYVPPTTYTIEDRGAPGRGAKKVPITERGALKKLGYGIGKSARTRHKALDKAVDEYGATKVWHRLLALRNVRERPAGEPGPSPPPKGTPLGKQWRILDKDMEYVKEKHRPKLTPTEAIKKWKAMH